MTPTSFAILAIDLTKYKAPARQRRCRRLTPRPVFGAALRRECRETNFPGAASSRVALNRSDDAQTDQEMLSPSAVLVLTDRAHIAVRQAFTAAT